MTIATLVLFGEVGLMLWLLIVGARVHPERQTLSALRGAGLQ